MFTVFRQPSSSFAASLKPMVGIAAAALLIGWATGVGAQNTPQSALPPLPPAKHGDTTQNNTAPPPLPLGQDDVRETQNQLIALGFNPGPADGQLGPATVAATQQYDQSRGGSGQVSIDSALLARLKADTAPRLTYDQVAARSQAASQAQAPASGANQLGGIVQQLAPLIGAAINSSNNYNNGYYNGGYYQAPPVVYGSPYYNPPPVAYGPSINLNF
jgi:hypothetical protein